MGEAMTNNFIVNNLILIVLLTIYLLMFSR